MKPVRVLLIATLLLVVGFCLAIRLEPWAAAQADNRGGGIFQLLVGDGRRMFANHFFAKADAYFHRGVYPTIFDAPLQEVHMADTGAEQLSSTNAITAAPPDPAAHEDHDHDADHDQDHEGESGTTAEPETPRKDWIARLNGRIRPEDHAHLEGKGEEREMLPWLRLSAELDPQRIQTYTVAAFWLRTRLGKPDEAEQFLREGLRANPGSPELLYELGQVYSANRNDPIRARNLYELALAQVDASPRKTNDDLVLLSEQILIRLARIEATQGNRSAAIAWLERLKPISPAPDQIQKQIEELRSGAAPDTKPGN